MAGSVGSILVFIFTASVLGVFFVVVFEEIHSANKERVRLNVMMGLMPLSMFGLQFMSVLRHYLVDSPGLMVVMMIMLLAMMGFATGIGCMMSLRTWVERSVPDNTQWGLLMLIYVCAGVGIPLLCMVSITITLFGVAH